MAVLGASPHGGELIPVTQDTLAPDEHHSPRAQIDRRFPCKAAVFRRSLLRALSYLGATSAIIGR